MLGKIRFAVWLFIMVVVAYFVAMNNISVSINLLPGYETIPLPLSVIIVISIVLGAILTLIVAIGDWIKFKIEIAKLKKQIEECEKERKSFISKTNEKFEQP